MRLGRLSAGVMTSLALTGCASDPSQSRAADIGVAFPAPNLSSSQLTPAERFEILVRIARHPDIARLTVALGLAFEETPSSLSDLAAGRRVTMAGLRGWLRVAAGTCDQIANGPGSVTCAQSEHGVLYAFQATIPVTRCANYPEAAALFSDHGWTEVRPSPPVDGPLHPQTYLMSLVATFRDDRGDLATFSPILKRSCIDRMQLFFAD